MPGITELSFSVLKGIVIPTAAMASRSEAIAEWRDLLEKGAN
jgi:hypothetical protein